MMEEVSDDTNGESSFEFVGGKIDETSKDETTSVPSPEQFFASASAPPDTSKHFPVPLPNLSAPTFPVASQKTESNITFYDIDPKDSKSILLPPLISPEASSQVSPSVPASIPPAAPSHSYTPSHYTSPIRQFSPVQQNYKPLVAPPQGFQIPPAPQPLYYGPQLQHSTFTVPLGGSDPTPQQMQPEGVWGWFKGKDFLNKVAEKAKNSVDSVITTLDPGMKEIINTGGDINVIVASGNEDKVSAVREAFQFVFGKATVQGIAVQSSSIAPQPVGFSAGLKAAEERINNLKQMGFAQDRQILLSIENFLAELTPENWFDMGCLLLQDQSSGISLQVYTEAIPISSQYVALAKDQTPNDYPLGWSGYAVTIGQIMGPALGVHHSLWHQALTGVSRREILFIAAKTIAGLYQSRLRR